MTGPQENILKRIRDLSTEQRIRIKTAGPLWRLLLPGNDDLVVDRPDSKDAPRDI